MKTYTIKVTPGITADKEIRRLFPDMVFWSGIFNKPSECKGRAKIRVYVKYWRGDWSGYVREHYGNLY